MKSISRIACLYVLCLSILQAQEKYTLQQDRVVALFSPDLMINNIDALLQNFLGTSNEFIKLADLYQIPLVAGQRLLPQGTVVYVGEKKRTSREIETFSGRTPIELWKIRIPSFSKQKVLDAGLPRSYCDAEFLYMIYYTGSSQPTAEELRFQEEQKAEALRTAKAEQAQEMHTQAAKALVTAARSADLRSLKELLQSNVL